MFFCVLFLFFSIRVFFHEHWQLTRQHGKGRDLFYSTLPFSLAHKHSDIYMQLCTWDDWLSHIFNRNVCIYQTATRWDLPPYRITILIDWWCDVDLRLFAFWFELRFCYSYSTWEKPVGPTPNWLSSLFNKRTD